MSDWNLEEINQLGKVVTGKTPPKSRSDYYEGDELFVSPKDFERNGGYVERTQTTISKKALEAFKNQVLPTNSVMFTSLSFGFGKMAIASRRLLTNQQIHSVIANKDHHFRFIYYLLRAYTPIIFSYNSGIDTPIVPKSVFEKIQVRCPELKLQRKIAAILTSYDDLIEVNERRITLLEKMAEELYREWFVRMRFPGYQNTRFVKGVPEGWEVKTIGSFCEEVRKSIKKKDLADDQVYIGLEHIPRNSISFKEWARAYSIDSNKLLFKERDILFSKIRPYLHKVALAHFSGACSSDTIVLRPRSRVYEAFLLFTVSSDTFIELATIASKGTKMPRADWAFLEKLELKVPPIELLNTYQSRFDEIFSLTVTLVEENQQAKSSRDLMLPRLISGKLSVNDLDIQFPLSMREDAA